MWMLLDLLSFIAISQLRYDTLTKKRKSIGKHQLMFADAPRFDNDYKPERRHY